MKRNSLPLLLLACATLSSRQARAWDVEVSSETIGQGYQLVGGTGEVISRRRLDQYLGVNVWNIGGKDAFGQPLPKNQFYFSSSLRMEFDFGDYPPQNNRIGSLDVSQELRTNRFDLLYAHVGGRDVWGYVDFKLGRQIDFSLFEFLSFDGLSATVKTPWYLALDAYGGLLVNGYLPIDSAIYRPDGTAPGVLSAHDADPKPVIGVGVHAIGFRDLDAQFGYRRVLSPGSGPACVAGSTDIQVIESCTKSSSGTSEEVIGWQGRYRLLDGRVIPWAGFRYNLLAGVFDVVEAGASININDRHSLRAEYLYSYPTFDGDSIWNVFARKQFDDVRIGYDLRISKMRAWARGFVRFFHDIDEADRLGGPTPIAPSGNLDGGGSLGARLDLPPGFVRADLYGEFGYGGTKVGGDLSTRMKVFRDYLALEGRLTFVHYDNDIRPVDHADSFGFQVGARVSFWKGMLLHVIFEDNINRYYNSQMRLYALLDLTALISGSGGYGFAPGTPRGVGPGMGNFGSPYGTGRGY